MNGSRMVTIIQGDIRKDPQISLTIVCSNLFVTEFFLSRNNQQWTNSIICRMYCTLPSWNAGQEWSFPQGWGSPVMGVGSFTAAACWKKKHVLTMIKMGRRTLLYLKLKESYILSVQTVGKMWSAHLILVSLTHFGKYFQSHVIRG